MKHTRHSLAFASAIIALTASSNAQSIYESFSYTSGTSLAAQSGGTGFSAGWASPGSAITANIVSGLSFGSLATSGNAVQITDTNANTWGAASVIQRNVASAPSVTYWQSNLIRIDTYGGGFNMVGVGSGSGGFGTGVTATNYGSAQAAIRNGGGDAGFGGSLSVGTVYLTIAQYSSSGVNAWIFTESGYTDWVTNGASQGSLGTYAFSSGSRAGDASFGAGVVLGGYSVGGAGTTATIDEVRFGASLANVTPSAIPEPSTYVALTGIAGLALAALRRRKV